MRPSTSPALLALVLAAGCTSTVPLQSNQAGISGSLTRHLFEPHQVQVEIDGKRYRGDWLTAPPSRQQVAVAPYPQRKQLGRVQAELSSDDGSRLHCRWETRGSKAQGKCQDGQAIFALDLD